MSATFPEGMSKPAFPLTMFHVKNINRHNAQTKLPHTALKDLVKRKELFSPLFLKSFLFNGFLKFNYKTPYHINLNENLYL